MVGAFIRKNLKASTILSYLSSVKKSHKVKGLDTSALSDKMVLAAIKGTKNRERMVPEKRVAMSLEDLATARLNLRKMKMPSKQKKACSMFKADWDMAYKHVAVRSEDHCLQVIEFGGRFLWSVA